MRSVWGGIAALFVLVFASTVQAAEQVPPPPTAEQAALIAKFQDIAKALHPQFGDVKLAGANATLHLGKAFYFLPADQARRIIVEAWGNAPDSAEGILGIVFPAGKSFADDSWAAVITFDNDGYIPDGDAQDVDYDAMLQAARDSEGEINDHRKGLNLEPIHFVGWAQPPGYDAAHHSLVWAREIRFGDAADHSLNYDLRALGRNGVLSMNIVSTMSHITDVRHAAGQLQNIGTFDAGARYTDFNSATDRQAAYGIGGLVAAGLGVVVAKKLGLLALGLVFAKKFFAVILAAAAGGFAWLRRLFTGRGDGAAT